MKNLGLIIEEPRDYSRMSQICKVQSQERSDRSSSSLALSSSLSLFSILQLDEIHLEGNYYKVYEIMKL